MSEKGNWYDNKELFEMIQELKEELRETTRLIKEYNGLRKKQYDFEGRLISLEQNLNNSKDSKKDRQWLLGWIVALVSVLYSILKGVL